VVAPEESPTPPRLTPATQHSRSPRKASTIELDVGGTVAPADIPGLCERARVLLESGDADRLICDVGGVADPDAVTIDALARLQLTARRLGREIGLRHASRDLRELLDFAGLSEVIPLSAGSRIDPRRQAEQREEGRGVEEEGDPADPIA
jgi:ABC-type transporter Mla MlaB component